MGAAVRDPAAASDAGRQRRYLESDVARVEWLRDRLSEGYRIGEAAALLGGPAGRAEARPKELREALYDAVAAGRTADVDLLLDQAFALVRLEPALREVVEPLLARIGEAWRAASSRWRGNTF